MIVTGLEILFIIVLLSQALRLYLNWREAGRAKEIPYVVDEASKKDWHWAEPPEELNLGVRNTEHESIIYFNSNPRSTEKACNLFAAFFAGLGIYLVLLILYRLIMQQPQELVLGLGLVVVIWLSAWALTSVDAPVIAVARGSDHLRIDVRRAWISQQSFFLQSPVKRGTSFATRLQGFLEMNTDQLDSSPDFYLLLKRPWRFEQQFILRVRPDQASWIVNGLNQWLEINTGDSNDRK